MTPPGLLRRLARRTLSTEQRARLLRLKAWPPVGHVRFGSLRRTTPISREFGFDRGTPVDRYYVERFLAQPPNPVRGVVLEIGDDRYTRRFGAATAIERSEILDVSPDNERATVIADLSDAPQLAAQAFDCVICAQTLLLIYDVRAAIETLHRILKPGGTLLVTVPGIAQIAGPEMGVEEADYWRFTAASARRLFEAVFDPALVTVEAYGNVLAATAFLYGVAAEELKRSELDARDPSYEVTIGVRAVKSLR